MLWWHELKGNTRQKGNYKDYREWFEIVHESNNQKQHHKQQTKKKLWAEKTTTKKSQWNVNLENIVSHENSKKKSWYLKNCRKISEQQQKSNTIREKSKRCEAWNNQPKPITNHK